MQNIGIVQHISFCINSWAKASDPANLVRLTSFYLRRGWLITFAEGTIDHYVFEYDKKI